MRKPAIILAFAGLAFAVGAAAAESADPPKSGRLICRGAAKSTGSHIRKPRRCRTAEQWRQEDEAAGRRPETLRIGAPKEEGRQRAQ